jgi:undecaprenyl diphosphate synthase
MPTKSSQTHVDERLQHIAFIMDGNGRWAQKRGLPREIGHKHGAKTFKNIVKYCGEIGLRAVTVYAFSTENWKRPEKEVSALIELLDSYIDNFAKDLGENDVKIKFIGDITRFGKKLEEKIKRVENSTQNNHFILNIAINYGGRAELVHAFNQLISDGKREVTEADISSAMYTAHCTDPDLIVRTGGDLRISNFLLWQAAYSEFYFTDTLWPDMSEKDVDEAINAFYSRKRRFGGV